MGSNPALRLKESPTLELADKNLDASVSNSLKTLDANNVLYALEASRDYDPVPAWKNPGAAARCQFRR